MYQQKIFRSNKICECNNKKYNKDYTGDVDYEVHHERPLYTVETMEGKKELDVEKKMKTIPVEEHKITHSYCGDVYHNFGPPQDYK